MGNGARKYGAWNWHQNPVEAEVYIAAARRHLLAWQCAETRAADSGVHHLGHVMACCAILMDAEAAGQLIDNRPAKGVERALQALIDWETSRDPGGQLP